MNNDDEVNPLREREREREREGKRKRDGGEEKLVGEKGGFVRL